MWRAVKFSHRVTCGIGTYPHRPSSCTRLDVSFGATATTASNGAMFFFLEFAICPAFCALPIRWAVRQRYGTLLPNVAVYCETPLGIAKPLWKKVIRVLNLIGLAFDNSKQPDLRAYDAWKGQNADKNASLWLRPRLRAQLKNVGAVLNWASSDKKITYVHLPAVGCGAFAGDMPVLSVWNDELALAVADWKDAHKDLIIDSGEIYPGTFHAGLQMTRVWDDLVPRPHSPIVMCLVWGLRAPILKLGALVLSWVLSVSSSVAGRKSDTMENMSRPSAVSCSLCIVDQFDDDSKIPLCQ